MPKNARLHIIHWMTAKPPHVAKREERGKLELRKRMDA
jgi:hypothetical protein